MVSDKRGKQGSILVIDHEVEPGAKLQSTLACDYELHITDRMDCGIQLLREKQPDVVIYNIRSQSPDGMEHLLEIREINPHVSVLILTGFGEIERVEYAIRHGATDYIEMPIDHTRIRSLIRKYVERSRFLARKDHVQEADRSGLRSFEGLTSARDNLTSLGAASAGLVQDMRNPLTLIRGYLDLINYELKEKHEWVTDELNEYLEQLEANVVRCSELVDSWRTLGRFDFSQMDRLSIPALAQECFHDSHPHSLINFSVEKEDERSAYEILGERLQLKHALQNLVDNAVIAVEHAREPSITIRLSENESEIDIQVIDNGCGVDVDKLRWILDPYSSSSVERGTGIGLFVAKKVAEEHQGELMFESEEGGGTTVTLRLPSIQNALFCFSSAQTISLG